MESKKVDKNSQPGVMYTGVGKGIGFAEQKLWAGIKIEQIWVGPNYRWP